MSTSIELIKADITTLKVDAIVNAANTTLLGGGGVDGAIHKAAGARLLEECKDLNGCPTGEARMTKGYDLPAKYVIHTVGPVWKDGKHNEPELLASCYRNSLELAKKYRLQTIAFPSISTGAYRFPIEKAAPIAIRTVNGFIKDDPATLEKIIFVLFSERDFLVYNDSVKTIEDRE